jgi:galactokinase
MVSIFRAVAAINRLPETEIWRRSLSTLPELTGYLGAMERGGAFGSLSGLAGVGTLGGSQDQTAILCAQPNMVVDFGWMPVVQRGSYALPATHCFVVASSGVVTDKSGTAMAQYNRASLMVRHLLASWNDAMGRDDRSLAAAMESDEGAPAMLRATIPEITTSSYSATDLRHRLDQFLLETFTMIPIAARAFATRDWKALADVRARSFAAANDGLGNQIDETRALFRLASANSAVAASAFGAGFGCSVWVLIAKDGVEAFTRDWARDCATEFPAAACNAVFSPTLAEPLPAHWFDQAARG